MKLSNFKQSIPKFTPVLMMNFLGILIGILFTLNTQPAAAFYATDYTTGSTGPTVMAPLFTIGHNMASGTTVPSTNCVPADCTSTDCISANSIAEDYNSADYVPADCTSTDCISANSIAEDYNSADYVPAGCTSTDCISANSIAEDYNSADYVPADCTSTDCISANSIEEDYNSADYVPADCTSTDYTSTDYTQANYTHNISHKRLCDSTTVKQIKKQYRSQLEILRHQLKDNIYYKNSNSNGPSRPLQADNGNNASNNGNLGQAHSQDDLHMTNRNTNLYRTLLRAEKSKLKSERDSLICTAIERKYLNNLTNYRSSWSRLIPAYSKIQIAGGTGTVSVGPGWDYGRKNQWETDLLIGYLPKYESQEWKMTLTIKQNYIPWSIRIGKGTFEFSPLTCGIYGSLVIGGDFWLKEPLRYPDRSYYRFPTRVRGHIFLGERITLNIKPGASRAHKSISFYYEICTHDLALMSICTNKYLSFRDATSLAFGLKFQIF
ncbi:MAG: hypothetical protein E7119_07215 [Bacteroidales bacterium]|nr:hypothetical protein [Bacteroidales bacterium]